MQERGLSRESTRRCSEQKHHHLLHHLLLWRPNRETLKQHLKTKQTKHHEPRNPWRKMGNVTLWTDPPELTSIKVLLAKTECRIQELEIGNIKAHKAPPERQTLVCIPSEGKKLKRQSSPKVLPPRKGHTRRDWNSKCSGGSKTTLAPKGSRGR